MSRCRESEVIPVAFRSTAKPSCIRDQVEVIYAYMEKKLTPSAEMGTSTVGCFKLGKKTEFSEERREKQ